jgi:hypothetical protein
VNPTDPYDRRPPQQAETSRQWFHLGGWLFDVRAAEDLLTARPRDPVALDVMTWAHAYGLDRLHQSSAPLVGIGPDFDPAYAMTTDLGTPVILATLRDASLLIDGCHRLYRAHAEARPTLPAFVLTPVETLSIRHHIGYLDRPDRAGRATRPRRRT